MVRWAIGFLALSLSALVLTRFHAFNGFAVLGIAIAAARFWPIRNTGDNLRYVGPAALGVIFGAYVLVFASPELETGWDNGVYNVIAHTIVDNGWPKVDMPYLAEADELLEPGLRDNYAGLYPGPGTPHAQFNHISPAVRAAFIDVFRENQLALSSAFLAALSVFFFSVLAKTMARNWWIVASLFLATNAAMIYVARSALSETFALTCFSITVIFCARTINRPSVHDSALAGIAFGCLMLSRVDGYLVSPILAATALVLLCRKPPAVKEAGGLLLPAAFFWFWSLFDLWANSYSYFITLWPIGLGAAALAGGAVIAAAIVIWVAALIAPKRIAPLLDLVEHYGSRTSAWLIVLLGVATLCLLLNSVIADQASLDRYMSFTFVRAPREFTWYVTVPLLILSFVGAWLIVRRDGLAGAAIAVPSVIIIVMFLAYTRITPVHPWGARRWVPFAIPLVLLLSIYAVSVFATARAAVAKFSAVFLTLVYGLQQHAIARNYWFQTNQAGLEDGYDSIAKVLKRHASPYFLTTDHQAAAVLTFLYHIPTIPLASEPMKSVITQIDDIPPLCGRMLWQTEGSDDIDWIGQPNQIIDICSSGKFYEPTSSLAKKSTMFTLVYGFYPRESWGVWSQGKASAIEVPSPATGKLVLNIVASALTLSATSPQVVGVSVEGQKVGVMTFSSSSPAPFSFPLPDELASGKAELRVSFDSNISQSPKSLKMSNDDRNLGFGLIDASVDDGDQGAAPKETN